MGKLVIAVLLMSCLLPATSLKARIKPWNRKWGNLSLKEFSLARFSDTLVYANNSVIDTNLIGEGFEGDYITDGGALECHTDDTDCCRSTDGMAGGEWHGPDGNVIIPANQIGSDNGLYRTRDHMVIRLNRRGGASGLPTGLYRCDIPGPGGVTITRYITLTRGGLCTDLPSLTNGDNTYTPPRVLSGVLPDGQRYQGTIATYSCSSGYQLVGGSTQRGCVGGTWNGTQPSCAITCDVSQLTNPANGQVSIEGIRATYTCDDGYTLVGSMMGMCQDNGTWSSMTPLCQIKDCGRLTAPADGQVDTSSGTTFGSTATYTCDTGYTLVGLTSRTCESTGRWSFNAPSCQIINCGSLTAPANGQVDTSSGTTFRSTATYICDTGYTLVGSMMRTCQDDGLWSSVAPTCQSTRSTTQTTSAPITSDFTPEVTSQDSLSSVGSGCSEVSGIVGGVIAVVWFLISILIIALLVVYILYLKRQLKGQDKGPRRQQTSGTQYETVGGGSAPEYKVMEGGGAEYEEIDKVKEMMGQPHPPKGDYELSQCAAYGPVNTDNA